VEEFTKEFNRLQATEGSRFEHASSELARIERRLRNIIEAISEGVPARTLKQELLALETRQDELRGCWRGGSRSAHSSIPIWPRHTGGKWRGCTRHYY